MLTLREFCKQRIFTKNDSVRLSFLLPLPRAPLDGAAPAVRGPFKVARAAMLLVQTTIVLQFVATPPLMLSPKLFLSQKLLTCSLFASGHQHLPKSPTQNPLASLPLHRLNRRLNWLSMAFRPLTARKTQPPRLINIQLPDLSDVIIS